MSEFETIDAPTCTYCNTAITFGDTVINPDGVFHEGCIDRPPLRVCVLCNGQVDAIVAVHIDCGPTGKGVGACRYAHERCLVKLIPDGVL